MKMNDLPDNLAQIAVRLSGIATNMCLALSVCDSEKAIKTMVRNHCDYHHHPIADDEQLADSRADGEAT